MISNSPGGGVNYLFDNGVTPYFSYSESFEPASQTGQAVISLRRLKVSSTKLA
jgi:outer membrane receptor protein involved in Fe transport